MSDVSVRAREILDAIERDAQARRRAMGAGVDGPLTGAQLLEQVPHRPAPRARGDRPLVRPQPPVPAAPPAPVRAAAPAAPPAPTPAPVPPAARPVAQVAAPGAPDPLRLLRLVDHVVAQAERAQQRLEELDRAVSALAARLDVAFTSTAAPGPAAPAPAATAAPEIPAVPVERPVPAGTAVEAAAAALPPRPRVRPKAEAEPVPVPVPEPEVVTEPEAYRTTEPETLAGATGAPLSEAAISDGARLVAIEMAVAGFTRDEVRERLSREYALTEMSGMLDEVFGQGSAGDSRMPWGAV